MPTRSSDRHVTTRRGFTLWETAIVLAVLSITLLLTAPALVGFGTNKAQSDAEALLSLLRVARHEAVQSGTSVAVRLDPTSRRFRVDTTGVAGMGPFASGTLAFGGATTMVTDQARLQFLFQPTGAAFADSVGVRGPGGMVMITVDPWNGVAHADPR